MKWQKLNGKIFSLDLKEDKSVVYDISLQPICVPTNDGACTAVVLNSYPIATVNSSSETSNYDWKVGEVIKNPLVVSPNEGTYKIKICTNLTNCDYSDNYFTIVSSVQTSNTPVISGVKGPQTLRVGQKAEWEVKAFAPMGGSLTYGVVWGDEAAQTEILTATRQTSQQTATFTHTYNQAGTYNPVFTVTSQTRIACFTIPCPSNAGSASTSISVVVSNTTYVCPVGCTCNEGMTTCRVEPKDDKSCLPGYKFSPKTGEACPIETTIDGCMPGYKFSPMTGAACPKIEDTKKEDKKVCTEPGSNCGVRNYGISRTLKHGVKGEDVKILQSLLNLIQDGVFGPETQQRLIDWQTKNGLTPDGVFGTQSRHKAGFED